MGIWMEKFEQYKAKVDMSSISTARKMFFATKPTETQIFYLDMVQARNNAAWAVLIAFSLFLGGFFGFMFFWIITHGIGTL